ncbi:dihydrofolate reductase family protein [Microbacterium sediminicola]|uniref:Dihydrofolate reductase family protein n=1 Tax=Microbacterium sediminicola TaxID=415210 RepID=A0ABN2HR41_9MICO
MPHIVYDTACTFNGWIADQRQSLQWLFDVPGADDPDPSIQPPSRALIVEGSSTYEWLLRESDLLAHPERWQEYFGDRRTFVFTSRRLPVPDGASVTFVSGPVVDLLPELRSAAGDEDIWIVGGGDLAGQFDDAGALDEIALTVAPVALDGGAPMMPRRIESSRLRLLEARAVGPFARLRYAVTPA